MKNYLRYVGTRNQRGKPGKPGNLRIRVSVPGEGGAWHNYPHQDISGDRATLLDSVIDMKNGVVSVTNILKMNISLFVSRLFEIFLVLILRFEK